MVPINCIFAWFLNPSPFFLFDCTDFIAKELHFHGFWGMTSALFRKEPLVLLVSAELEIHRKQSDGLEQGSPTARLRTGTGPWPLRNQAHSRRWAASKRKKLHLPLPMARITPWTITPHPPHPPSVEKLSCLKPVPGAVKVRDRWVRETERDGQRYKHIQNDRMTRKIRIKLLRLVLPMKGERYGKGAGRIWMFVYFLKSWSIHDKMLTLIHSVLAFAVISLFLLVFVPFGVFKSCQYCKYIFINNCTHEYTCIKKYFDD